MAYRLRYPKGTRKGGQFRGRVGADARRVWNFLNSDPYHGLPHYPGEPLSQARADARRGYKPTMTGGWTIPRTKQLSLRRSKTRFSR